MKGGVVLITVKMLIARDFINDDVGLGLTCKLLSFFHSLKIIHFYSLISINRERIRSAIPAPGKRKRCEEEDVGRRGETGEGRVTFGLGRCLKCHRRGGGGGAHLRIQASQL